MPKDQNGAKAKKPSGADSVLKMVQETQIRADLMAVLKEQSKTQADAVWHAKAETRDPHRQRVKDTMALEVKLAGEEIKASRTQSLKRLYTAEAAQFKAELLEKGLAIEKDRV